MTDDKPIISGVKIHPAAEVAAINDHAVAQRGDTRDVALLHQQRLDELKQAAEDLQAEKVRTINEGLAQRELTQEAPDEAAKPPHRKRAATKKAAKPK